jgi:predicted amidophosphoribosyltransferase
MMKSVKYICPECGYESEVAGLCPNCQVPLVASCPECGNPIVGELIQTLED